MVEFQINGEKNESKYTPFTFLRGKTIVLFFREERSETKKGGAGEEEAAPSLGKQSN